MPGGYNGGSLDGGRSGAMTKAWTEKEEPHRAAMPLTTAERALLRLLVSGRPLAEAAPALGLSLGDAERLLARLQSRCGICSVTRLLVLAVLNAWV